MFALFFSLYYSMFTGEWVNFGLIEIKNSTLNMFNGLGEFLTSIFGDTTAYGTLGDVLLTPINGVYPYITLVAFVLALITCIGIVVMAVKGIKRIFSVFFYGVR